jgi:LuxR family maltose regulon positive regulatory protein
MRWASGMSEWVAADMAAERARLWLSQGNLAAARDWAENSGLATSDTVPFHREKEYRIFARVLIADGKAAQALRLLAPLVDLLAALRANHSLISARVLQALALQDCGDSAQALSALTPALSLGEPEGYLRTFVDDGEPLAKLLRRAQSNGVAPDYVNRLLVALEGVPQPAQTEAQPLVEPLTERELEVLRLIAAGLSNQQIAEELVIAVSTVKSHINHIYGKLEVRNRTQALATAQRLGLL